MYNTSPKTMIQFLLVIKINTKVEQIKLKKSNTILNKRTIIFLKYTKNKGESYSIYIYYSYELLLENYGIYLYINSHTHIIYVIQSIYFCECVPSC